MRVSPERLARWLEGFAERHGGIRTSSVDDVEVTVVAADESTATLRVPYPPMPDEPGSPVERLVVHALVDRTLGLVLLRRGGVAVGVAVGPALVASKVDRRRVQGRSAAGGWSQQRFARRRDGQTRAVVELAVEHAERLVVPRVASLDAVVLGGDRLLLQSLRSDPRLRPLWTRPAGPVLDVPDPRQAVLESAVAGARAVRVRLQDG